MSVEPPSAATPAPSAAGAARRVAAWSPCHSMVKRLREKPDRARLASPSTSWPPMTALLLRPLPPAPRTRVTANIGNIHAPVRASELARTRAVRPLRLSKPRLTGRSRPEGNRTTPRIDPLPRVPWVTFAKFGRSRLTIARGGKRGYSAASPGPIHRARSSL